MQAIDGQSLDNVAVVVIRWFGGILLGSGGLMRAYGGTAATCLRTAEKVPVIPSVMADIACGFSDLARVKARLGAVPSVRIDMEVFTDSGADMRVSIPLTEVQDISRLLSDITSGRVVVRLPT